MFAKWIYIILAVILLFQVVYSQKEVTLLPRFAIRAECNVPKVIGSQAYRISFNGLYDGGIKLTARVKNNFCLGVGYDNALFNTTTLFRDPYGRNINTRQQVHNGVFSFVYDKILTEKTFLTLSLNTGGSYNKYTGVVALYDSLYTSVPTEFITGFIRPEMVINFLVEDNFAFGIHLSYNMSLYSFDPKLPRLDKYENYGKYKNKSNVGWISFGFGFYFGFKSKAKAAS
jgi:hypothetical protein